jgi:glutaredoxin 3
MITVYTSPTCGFCHMVKAYLESKGLSFKERDISQDQEALQWIANNIGQLATPVIDIDGEVILGFDRERIDLALRAKKLV